MRKLILLSTIGVLSCIGQNLACEHSLKDFCDVRDAIQTTLAKLNNYPQVNEAQQRKYKENTDLVLNTIREILSNSSSTSSSTSSESLQGPLEELGKIYAEYDEYRKSPASVESPSGMPFINKGRATIGKWLSIIDDLIQKKELKKAKNLYDQLEEAMKRDQTTEIHLFFFKDTLKVDELKSALEEKMGKPDLPSFESAATHAQMNPHHHVPHDVSKSVTKISKNSSMDEIRAELREIFPWFKKAEFLFYLSFSMQNMLWINASPEASKFFTDFGNFLYGAPNEEEFKKECLEAINSSSSFHSMKDPYLMDSGLYKELFEIVKDKDIKISDLRQSENLRHDLFLFISDLYNTRDDFQKSQQTSKWKACLNPAIDTFKTTGQYEECRTKVMNIPKGKMITSIPSR